MARIYPDEAEIGRLATPLNAGEEAVMQFLGSALSDEWHIFIQPHLLSLSPDFVVASRREGVTVIEVKDWSDGSYRDTEGRLEVRDQGFWTAIPADPMRQAHRYRSVLAEQFLTPPTEDSLFSASTRSSVVLPAWQTRPAEELLRSTTELQGSDKDWVPVLGREVFGDENLLNRLLFGTKKPAGLDEATFERLLMRLRGPEALAEQRRPLALSAGAKNLERNRDGARIRRAKGAAGSGKTVGLAARAARLAETAQRAGRSHDRILVLCFNITLAHYIQDLVRRQTRHLGVDHRRIDCTHFHGFCSDVAASLGIPLEPSAGEERHEALVRVATEAYSHGHPGLPKYDAILVDEGQDFEAHWWTFLRESVLRSENGEMLLAADATQDIYAVGSWTDESTMAGFGFRGPWTVLEGCYRLPPDLIPVVAEFAATHLGTDADPPDVPADHSGIAAATTEKRWLNVSSQGVADVVANEVNDLLSRPDGPHPADVVYLTFDHQSGADVAERLTAEGVDIEHIFVPGDGEVHQRKRQAAKKRFWPGVARTKGCTVHSFKGWEARAVVILVEGSVENSKELTYVALSRVKGDPTNLRRTSRL